MSSPVPSPDNFLLTPQASTPDLSQDSRQQQKRRALQLLMHGQAAQNTLPRKFRRQIARLGAQMSLTPFPSDAQVRRYDALRRRLAAL